MRKYCAMAVTCSLLMSSMMSEAAFAGTRITPYIEAQQIADAQFNNGGDVLTYSALAAGIDGRVTNQRMEAQLSYRYERRIPWNDGLADDTVHSGLARARAELVTNLLSVEGGAIATRSRTDIRGEAPVFLTGDNSNIAQVYGFYGGPSVAHRVAGVDVSGNYRVGYVRVSSNGNFIPAAGQPAIDRFDHATSHDVDVSVAMPAGRFPFAWTITAGYMHESSSQLDQRYIGKYIRDDVVWPVSPHIAATGGIGYENIRISERATLRDADGFPILDGNGRYVVDRSSPRLLAYATDGIIWDAGVIWKPNRRTTAEVRYGERYGSHAVTGSLDYKFGRRSGLHIVVYDAIDSFGRSLTRNLAALPTSFTVDRNALTGDFNGCIFGNNSGEGGCLNGSLQSMNTANYRSRGVSLTLSGNRGPWDFGLGGGYANHKYLTPRSPGLFNIDGAIDKSLSAQGDIGRALSSVSGISANVFANWYKSGIGNSHAVTDIGTTASYYRNFTDRLIGQISGGVYNSHIRTVRSDTHAQAVVSLRYQF